jgi:two-component system sensor histidine kinase BaeS
VAVRGDGHRLRQVVNNLLDNAIKFTPAGGRVTLELRRDGARGAAVLSVADTGAGIDAEDLPHVFERFYRGDKARGRGRQGGTGLGLSICQSIVTAHGGSIDVHSAPGAGTEVIVRLPALAPAAGEPAPSHPGSEPLQERRLM